MATEATETSIMYFMVEEPTVDGNGLYTTVMSFNDAIARLTPKYADVREWYMYAADDDIVRTHETLREALFDAAVIGLTVVVDGRILIWGVPFLAERNDGEERKNPMHRIMTMPFEELLTLPCLQNLPRSLIRPRRGGNYFEDPRYRMYVRMAALQTCVPREPGQTFCTNMNLITLDEARLEAFNTEQIIVLPNIAATAGQCYTLVDLYNAWMYDTSHRQFVGIQFSNPGVMYNTENPDRRYRHRAINHHYLVYRDIFIGRWILNPWEVIQRFPACRVFYTVPLGRFIIGSEFGVSNVHDQEHEIYAWVPLYEGSEFGRDPNSDITRHIGHTLNGIQHASMEMYDQFRISDDNDMNGSQLEEYVDEEPPITDEQLDNFDDMYDGVVYETNSEGVRRPLVSYTLMLYLTSNDTKLFMRGDITEEEFIARRAAPSTAAMMRNEVFRFKRAMYRSVLALLPDARTGRVTFDTNPQLAADMMVVTPLVDVPAWQLPAQILNRAAVADNPYADIRAFVFHLHEIQFWKSVVTPENSDLLQNHPFLKHRAETNRNLALVFTSPETADASNPSPRLTSVQNVKYHLL